MTSATTTPAQGASGHRAEGQGYGLVLFALWGCARMAAARTSPPSRSAT
jgi:hypothetical protein